MGRTSTCGTKSTTEPERFTIDTLQKVHKLRYDKALVDIISMVKHAARDQEPLLTAAERVQRALAKITAGQSFTLEQQQWLNRIGEHLTANLSINQEDFEWSPVLSRPGGWAPADRAFAGKLQQVIESLNEAIAA